MKSVEQIISVLEHAKERPGMYTLNSQEVDNVKNFLAGFQVACDTLGYGYGLRAASKVRTRRGWERWGSSAELVSQKTGMNMKDSGMSEQETVAELFAIEIECWREVPGVSTPPV